MLELRGIFKTFEAGSPNEVRALQGIGLGVRNGDFVVLLGTNGSGKSSLLGAVAGTFSLDSGTVEIDGRDVTEWPEHKRARWIGRVFQNPYAGTAPDMSLAENLALAARKGKHRGLGWALGKRIMREMRERIAPLRMGLERRLGERMGSLSGGERQALTLLMATWTRPKLLLLDEHTAALDPRAAEMVIQLTEETIRKDNLTTLMVTHSMQQAASLGDRILMMHKGRIIHDFSGDEKRRLKAQDLLDLFNEARRRDLLGDPS